MLQKCHKYCEMMTLYSRTGPLFATTAHCNQVAIKQSFPNCSVCTALCCKMAQLSYWHIWPKRWPHSCVVWSILCSSLKAKSCVWSKNTSLLLQHCKTFWGASRRPNSACEGQHAPTLTCFHRR